MANTDNPSQASYYLAEEGARPTPMHAAPPSIVQPTNPANSDSVLSAGTTAYSQQVVNPPSRSASRSSSQPSRNTPVVNQPTQYIPPPQSGPGQSTSYTAANWPAQYISPTQVDPSLTSATPADILTQPSDKILPTYQGLPMIDARTPLNRIQATNPYAGRARVPLPGPLARTVASHPAHSAGSVSQHPTIPPFNSGTSLPNVAQPIGPSQTLEVNHSEQRPRKRLRNSDFKPSDDGTLFNGGIMQLPTSIQDQLINATRQLSKPRSTPGPSDPSGDHRPGQSKGHAGSNGKRPIRRATGDDSDELEELSEVTQEEGAEITRSVYEDNLEDENGPAMRRVYRLMNRMIQKQEALRNSLEAMKQDTQGSNEPLPPRVSPAKPLKEVNWDQSIACTEPAGRQPRVTRKVLTSKIIRIILMKLCKRKSNKDPMIPPPEDVPFPTVDRFYIECTATETSLFNRLAAKIVVEAVVKYWDETYKDAPLTQAEIDTLPYLVSEHISYLCGTYKDSLRTNAEEFRKLKLKRAGAASRRSTLYHSRLKVIDRFGKALGMHRLLIVVLGLAGTSSDEEDNKRPGTYLIRNQTELSSRVQILKRKLDLLYALYFKGPGSRGSQMHVRAPSNLPSRRTFAIEGLPVTCLSHRWLRSLTELEREFYQFTPHKYNYSFPDVLLRRNVQPDPSAIVMSEDDGEEEDGEEEDRQMQNEEEL